MLPPRPYTFAMWHNIQLNRLTWESSSPEGAVLTHTIGGSPALGASRTWNTHEQNCSGEVAPFPIPVMIVYSFAERSRSRDPEGHKHRRILRCLFC